MAKAETGWNKGLKKRNGSDYYSYRFYIDGQLFTGSTEQRLHKDALKELERVKNLAKNQMLGTSIAEDTLPTVAKAVEIWKEDNAVPVKSEKHIRTFGNAAKWFVKVFGNKRLDLVTNDDVAKLVREYVTPYDANKKSAKVDKKTKKVVTPAPVMRTRTESGCNNILRYLSLLYSHFVDTKKWISKRPFDINFLSEQEKEIRYLTKEELPVFFAAIDKTGNLHQSVACRFMVYMGLRENEALAAKRAGFNLSEGIYTPPKTKGKEAKPLHLHKELLLWLKKLPENKSEYFMLNEETNLPHTEGFTKKAVERGAKAVGRKITPHDLRRTCATLLCKNKTNALVVQRIMRHKSLSTTRKYAALDITDEAAAIDSAFG